MDANKNKRYFVGNNYIIFKIVFYLTSRVAPLIWGEYGLHLCLQRLIYTQNACYVA